MARRCARNCHFDPKTLCFPNGNPEAILDATSKAFSCSTSSHILTKDSANRTSDHRKDFRSCNASSVQVLGQSSLAYLCEMLRRSKSMNHRLDSPSKSTVPTTNNAQIRI